MSSAGVSRDAAHRGAKRVLGDESASGVLRSLLFAPIIVVALAPRLKDPILNTPTPFRIILTSNVGQITI